MPLHAPTPVAAAGVDSGRSVRGTRRLQLLLALVLGSALTSPLFAGSVFVSGHDSDFHAQAGNTTGAQNIINRALDFVRNGNTAPILMIKSNTFNVGLGDHLDSENGLIASGYTAGNLAGNHYVTVNFLDFATIDLSLYSALFVPADHGGTLTGDDLKALNARSADILAYVNNGGGLFALAEDGFHVPAAIGPEGPLFGFLPFLATSVPHSEYENGNTLSAFGASLGLTNFDINGNFSHNVFTSTGGMTPVDYTGGGEILSLATRFKLTPGGVDRGVPDTGSTVLLLTAGLAGLALAKRRLRV